MPRSRELAELATSYDSGGLPGMRNRIINGAMVIDQRNNGASSTAQNAYTVDRFVYRSTQALKGTWGQNLNNVAPPQGFVNYLGFQSSSAYSVLATDIFDFEQSIEANNVSDFGWGAVGAVTVVLSFWVRSSLTGTFAGSVRNYAATRAYGFNYTIPTANTWTYITVTIPGDTGGSWVMSGNAGSINVNFTLGVGATYAAGVGAWSSGAVLLGGAGGTSVVGTNGATFYITGVQLEAGSVATPFERRDYGRELIMCRRYLPVVDGTATASYYVGQCASTVAAYSAIYHDVVARVPPTGITLTGAASTYIVTSSTAASINCTAISWNSGGVNSSLIVYTVASGLAAGNATLFNLNGNKILFTGCEL